MRLGLVLGGGGLVGMGYHAGALKALDEWGLDVGAADLMVGTSAGSIMASYMAAADWTPDDFYNYAHGKHPDVQKDPADPKEQLRQVFTPLSHSAGERVRRSVGSMFALASSRGYVKKLGGGLPAQGLRKAFPAGIYSTEETRRRFQEDLPAEWPDRKLYICAVDLYSGERIAFGHPAAPEAPLPEAVLASTSIPGIFPPVRIDGHQYVDGGVASATSLDLATDNGCELILCIAPLGYRNDGLLSARDPKMWSAMFVRSLFARSLRREVVSARERGSHVLVVRPWVSNLKLHGTNSMRAFDRAALTDNAREGTLRLLQENEDHPVLAGWKRKSTRKKAG
ncbi:MAG: patatin-like phospholipase family protein [Actinomycetota bacterium]